MRQRLSLSDILIKGQHLDEAGLRSVRAEQALRGGSMPECVVRLGMMRERQLVVALSRALGIPALVLRGRAVHPDVLALVPGEIACKYACLPLFTRREGDADVLYLGVEDPTDLGVIDEVSFRVGRRVRPVVVGPLELREALTGVYPDLMEAPQVVGPVAERLDDAQRDEVEPSAADTTPVLDAPSPPAAAPAQAPELPTRDIVRALTRLLIAKGVFTRTEFMEAVRKLPPRDTRGGDEG